MDKKQRILLVEDDQRLAELIRDYLQQQGFEVLIEGRGDTAPGRILKENPDLLILDLMLPGKDGLVHISQIANERVENVSDYLKEGEEVRVKVLDVDQRGRIKLSIKELLEDEAGADESSTGAEASSEDA